MNGVKVVEELENLLVFTIARNDDPRLALGTSIRGAGRPGSRGEGSTRGV